MDSYDDADISVLTLATGDVKVLIEGGSNPKYSTTGHIVYGRDGNIMAVRFDRYRLEIVGQPDSVIPGVVTSHAWGLGQFDFAGTGTLAYLPGTPEVYYPAINWFDRSGNSEPFGIPSRDFREVHFSPDGTKVALRESKGNDDIWSYDIARGTLTRITSRWDNAGAAWSADGQSILYTAVDPGAGIVKKAADGSGAETILLPPISNGSATVGDASPDGEHLLYNAGGNIWLLPLNEERTPSVLIGSDFIDSSPRFSPNGEWVAYSSDESGRREIYVQPFPGSGSRTLISTGGGSRPRWRGDGRELYFYGEDAIQSATIQTEPDFEAGAPIILFERPDVLYYDVTPDGSRFLVIEDSDATPAEIHVVVNWHQELNRLVPPSP